MIRSGKLVADLTELNSRRVIAFHFRFLLLRPASGGRAMSPVIFETTL